MTTAEQGAVKTTSWFTLLDAVAAGGQRLVLEAQSGARVVLVAESDLRDLESAAAAGGNHSGRSAVVVTPRERDVLQLVATGSSGAQAAAVLGVAANTVAQHLASVRRKYGVRTSAAAVAAARAGGQLG